MSAAPNEWKQPGWYPLIILILTQMAVGIWWAASLSSEVRSIREISSSETARLKEETRESRLSVEIKLQRLDEKIEALKVYNCGRR